MAPRTVGISIAVLLVAGCGGDTSPPPTAPTTTATTAPTTTVEETTTTGVVGALVLPVALEVMPDTWVESFFIPYGDGPDTLGTSPGGDSGSVQWGPEYGAQSGDGTWWFLDAARLRVAHFSETGEYLDEWPIPEEMLVGGIYFQYQLPRVLDDGTMLASRLGGAGTAFLRIKDGVLDEVTVPVEIVPRTDDGELIYGFAFGDEPVAMAVDIGEASSVEVEWFRTRAGDRFWIEGVPGGLRVALPDASPPVDVVLAFEAGEVGGGAFVSLEVASGEDGSIHLFLLGFPNRDESIQLAGYLTIGPDGAVGPLEPMRDPFTESDPGSPARLGVRPGTSDPWIMLIDTDGVRVFHRS